MSTDEVLSVSHVSKSFGELDVLKDMSLTVSRGEVVSVIGPSGSGKSTLLRVVNQLERAESGDISVCGQVLCQNDDKGFAVYSDKEILKNIRLSIGLVFQSFHLFPHYSILKNIIEAPVQVLKKSREEAEEKARELLNKLGLSDKESAYPYQLSGGQQQRVAIALSLIHI